MGYNGASPAPKLRLVTANNNDTNAEGAQKFSGSKRSSSTTGLSSSQSSRDAVQVVATSNAESASNMDYHMNSTATHQSTTKNSEGASGSNSTSTTASQSNNLICVEGCGIQAAVLKKQRSAKERQRDKQRKRKLVRDSIKQRKVNDNININNYKNSDELKAYIRERHQY